jgi:hypothetical protein
VNDARRVGPFRMVGRGLLRRCPRCGGGKVVRRWFRLQDRCPTCGHRFKREEGFFTGVILVNFGTTLALMWLFIIAWLVWHEATDSDAGLAPVLGGALLLAVVTPVAFYPFATTVWAALDLAMRPLEPDEAVAAARWLEGQPDGEAGSR